jgi:hypothetical protein
MPMLFLMSVRHNFNQGAIVPIRGFEVCFSQAFTEEPFLGIFSSVSPQRTRESSKTRFGTLSLLVPTSRFDDAIATSSCSGKIRALLSSASASVDVVYTLLPFWFFASTSCALIFNTEMLGLENRMLPSPKREDLKPAKT